MVYFVDSKINKADNKYSQTHMRIMLHMVTREMSEKEKEKVLEFFKGMLSTVGKPRLEQATNLKNYVDTLEQQQEAKRNMIRQFEEKEPLYFALLMDCEKDEDSMPNMEKYGDKIYKLMELVEKIQTEDKDKYLEENEEFVNKILSCFDEQYETEGKWRPTDLESLL